MGKLKWSIIIPFVVSFYVARISSEEPKIEPKHADHKNKCKDGEACDYPCRKSATSGQELSEDVRKKAQKKIDAGEGAKFCESKKCRLTKYDSICRAGSMTPTFLTVVVGLTTLLFIAISKY